MAATITVRWIEDGALRFQPDEPCGDADIGIAVPVDAALAAGGCGGSCACH